MQFYVTPGEMEQIREKMRQMGTANMSAYLRKMALDGLVIRLDLPELRELVSLMRRASNNLNQIAKRVNESGHVYEADILEVKAGQEKLLKRIARIDRPTEQDEMVRLSSFQTEWGVYFCGFFDII